MFVVIYQGLHDLLGWRVDTDVGNVVYKDLATALARVKRIRAFGGEAYLTVMIE